MALLLLILLLTNATLAAVIYYLHTRLTAVEDSIRDGFEVEYDEEPYQEIEDSEATEEESGTEETPEPEQSELDMLAMDVANLGGQMDGIYDLHNERLAEIQGLDQRVIALESRVTVLETQPPPGSMSSIIDSRVTIEKDTKVPKKSKAKAKKSAKRGRA